MGVVSRRGPYKTKIKSKPKPNEAGTTKHPSVSEDKELIVEQITDEKGNIKRRRRESVRERRLGLAGSLLQGVKSSDR